MWVELHIRIYSYALINSFQAHLTSGNKIY